MTPGAYWPWYVGGLALAGIALTHWYLLRRTLAVSGRVTALVDRVRRGGSDAGSLTLEEQLAALEAATLEEFGAEFEAADTEAAVAGPHPPTPAPNTPAMHVLFLASVAAGGFVAAVFTGRFALRTGIDGELFATLFGSVPAPVVLVIGGALVGFGTRMAGGCTSGHGLCGVSRFQPGSLLATAAFFGAGVAASFALEALS